MQVLLTGEISNKFYIDFSDALVMKYAGLFGQYHACWCPGCLSHQGITRNSIDSIR